MNDTMSAILAEKPKDEIEDKHLELRAALEEATDAKDFWTTTVQHPEFEELRMKWETQAQTYREALENAKGDEVKTLQSDIRARKAMLSALEDMAGNARVAVAREALSRFETQNAIFLAPRNKPTTAAAEAAANEA